jgi:hypothetical protein
MFMTKTILGLIFVNGITGFTFTLFAQAFFKLFYRDKDQTIRNLKHKIIELEQQIQYLQQSLDKHILNESSLFQDNSKLEDILYNNYEIIDSNSTL